MAYTRAALLSSTISTTSKLTSSRTKKSVSLYWLFTAPILTCGCLLCVHSSRSPLYPDQQRCQLWTNGSCKMRNNPFLLYRNLQIRECHNYYVSFYTRNTEKKTCIIHSLSYKRSIAPSKTRSPQSAI